MLGVFGKLKFVGFSARGAGNSLNNGELDMQMGILWDSMVEKMVFCALFQLLLLLLCYFICIICTCWFKININRDI